MSQKLFIQGPHRLSGEVTVSGAKNAVLPMLMAAVLTAEEVTYTNVPEISDVNLSQSLLESIGCKVDRTGDSIKIATPVISCCEPPVALIKSFRASFWILAPLLARYGKAKVFLPGGDIIGKRPVDIHLEGLASMGAKITMENSVVIAEAPSGGLRPTTFHLNFPSVGATHQLLLAAALTPGKSVFTNVAREPEVVALANLLIGMGAEIIGAGTERIEVIGKKNLHSTKTKLIGDRIEAATYILATVATRGELVINGFDPKHLGKFLDILTEMGVNYTCNNHSMVVKAPEIIKAVNVETAPFPGLATDIQAQLMSCLTVANGQSTISEKIYESRFAHVAELNKMGAKIQIEGALARISGVACLRGTTVKGHDIRAAAAILIAGLVAEGETVIQDAEHLMRGYSKLMEKLIALECQVSLNQHAHSLESNVGC